MHVLGHDGHALRVDGAQVGVFEEADLLSRRGARAGPQDGFHRGCHMAHPCSMVTSLAVKQSAAL